MKILLLSDVNSVHTKKWVIGLSSKGFTIGIFSLSRSESDWFSNNEGVSLLHQPKEMMDAESIKTKLLYISTLKKLKAVIHSFQPDILHSHYASSYGLLGALSKFHPYIISVWGADVYDFPNKSFVHKTIFKFNLNKADKILSTSEVMKTETEKYTYKSVDVTPFGVDTQLFSPTPKKINLFSKDDLVVGLIKSLEPKYGIEVLIKAFKLAHEQCPELSLKLLLVGGGSLDKSLKNLVYELGITEHVLFTGKIAHEQIPYYHNEIDIFVSTSIDDSESFGVSIVESCACSKAVVVARTGGLKEVILENQTGLIVEKNDPVSTADAIIRFAKNPNLRFEFGLKARQHVINNYNWTDNLNKMSEIYQELIKK